MASLLPDLTYDQYVKLDGVNFTCLSMFRKTAAHARAELESPRSPTSPQAMGIGAHAKIFEPERFQSEFLVCPRVDRRTKAGRESWAKFEETSAGRTVLTQDEMTQIEHWTESCRRHRMAPALLDGVGHNELSFTWDDSGTGVTCKGRLDRLTTLSGWTVLIDLKTTLDASPDGFAREVMKWQYHARTAWYLRGLRSISDVPRRALWWAVEKKRPYCSAVYEPSTEMLEQGNSIAGEYMQRYAHAKSTGEWPGYDDGVLPLELPAWARSEKDDA